jgi:hypothetical protein
LGLDKKRRTGARSMHRSKTGGGNEDLRHATDDLGVTWRNLSALGGYPAPLMPLLHAVDPRPFTQMVFNGSRVVFWAKPCDRIYFWADDALTSYSSFVPSFPGATAPYQICVQSIAADNITGDVYISTMQLDASSRVDASPLFAHVFRSSCRWNPAWPVCEDGSSLQWNSITAGLLLEPTLVPPIMATSLVWLGMRKALAVEVFSLSSTRVFRTATAGRAWIPVARLPPSSSPQSRLLAWPGGRQLFHADIWGESINDYLTSHVWDPLWCCDQHLDVRAFYWSSRQGFLWMATDGARGGAFTTPDGTPDADSPGNITRWHWAIGTTPTPDRRIPTRLGDLGIEDEPSDGLPVIQAYFVAVALDPSTPDGTRSFMGAQDNGMFCADGRGGTWGFQLGGDSNSIVFAPTDPNRAYFRNDGTFWATTSAGDRSGGSCDGAVWAQARVDGSLYGDSVPELWTRTMMAVDLRDENIVYLARANNFGVGRYDPAANTLTVTPTALPGNARPVSVFVHPVSGRIYVGTLQHGAFVSEDGMSFSNFALNACPPDCPVPTVVMDIAWSPVPGGDGTFYLATTSGLYAKAPGATWTRVEGDGSYTASRVIVDLHCPNRVNTGWGYVGELGRHRGGVTVRHVDDMQSPGYAISAGSDIHGSPITDLQVDPVYPQQLLHVATYGRGVWLWDRGSDDCNAF